MPTIHKVSNNVIAAALCQSIGLNDLDAHFSEQTLDAAHEQFPGMSLGELLLLRAAAGGYSGDSRITAGNVSKLLECALQASGSSGVNFVSILDTVADKVILDGYQETDQSWREISRIHESKSFMEAESVRILADAEFKLLPRGGTADDAAVSDEKFTRKVNRYARKIVISEAEFLNDDLSVFDKLKAALGYGAGQSFNNVFWPTFLESVSTLFTTGNGNLITGGTTNLGSDAVGLALGLVAFQNLRSPVADGAKRLVGNPAVLLVPPELEAIANAIYCGRNLSLDGGSYEKMYRPVSAPWLSDTTLTGSSTKAWYLFRKSSILAPMNVSFLNGAQTPRLITQAMTGSQLGVCFSGSWDFGIDAADPLSGIRSKGEA